MSSSTSSLVDSTLQQFSRLISSGRLTAYENEVPSIYWEDELGGLRIWANEAKWWSLEVQLLRVPAVRDQLIRLLRRVQQALADIHDVLDKDTADEAISANTTGDDADRPRLHMIHLSLHKTIGCLNQMTPIIRGPGFVHAFGGAALEDDTLLSVLLQAPDLSKDETPADQLLHLWSYLLGEVEPLCRSCITRPPTDKEIRDSVHKTLKETIQVQVILKAETIEPSGDAGLRDLRQELIREAQKVLSKFDQAVKLGPWWKQLIRH